MRILLVLLCLLVATSASSDVLFGEDGRSFNDDDWTVSGDGETRSWGILFPAIFSTTGARIDATVDSEATAEGIVVDILFGGWTSSRSTAIIDDSGQTRLYMWMTSSNTVRATALGQTIGDIPYNFGDLLRITVDTPAFDSDEYQWMARIENVGLGAAVEYVEPGVTPMLFLGPITVQVRCGYGVGGSISRVAVLGDSVVDAKAPTWESVKALYLN